MSLTVSLEKQTTFNVITSSYFRKYTTATVWNKNSNLNFSTQKMWKKRAQFPHFWHHLWWKKKKKKSLTNPSLMNFIYLISCQNYCSNHLVVLHSWVQLLLKNNKHNNRQETSAINLLSRQTVLERVCGIT